MRANVMRHYLVLILILILAFFLGYIPHFQYPYPIHIDEWTHLAYARAVAQTGSLTFPDPFTGQTTMDPANNGWMGFHVFCAMVQEITGIQWITLFTRIPAFIFMLTVLAVYILTRREG
jgi:hypothetical protein